MFAESYAKYYDQLNEGKPYKEEIEFVYDWARQPKSILDLGCGTAQYWRYFPHHVKMVGLEKSNDMIKRAPSGQLILKGDICKATFEMFFAFECVTALFDVVNYLPNLNWMNRIPIKKRGFFIFDVLEKKKAEKFERTERCVGNVSRIIKPLSQSKNKVTLDILTEEDGFYDNETHELFLWTEKDIEKVSKDSFDIVETKQTETWQKWYKLKKK